MKDSVNSWDTNHTCTPTLISDLKTRIRLIRKSGLLEFSAAQDLTSVLLLRLFLIIIIVIIIMCKTYSAPITLYKTMGALHRS